MSDNLTKGRIAKYTGWIKEVGLTPPDVNHLASLSEQEAAIKEFWNQNKPDGWVAPGSNKAPKLQPKDLGEKVSDRKANEDIIAAMRQEIAELKALVSTPQVKQAGSPEDFAKAIEMVLKSQRDGAVEKGMVRPGYVPPEDVLEEPVTFFTPQQNEYLSFRYEGGLKVLPPHDQPYIKFDNKFRWSVKSGNTYKIRAIAVYKCRSKAEKEWIMKHPKFGNTIFLESAKAIAASEYGEWAQQYNRFYAGVVNMSDTRLPSMAHTLGLPVSTQTLPDEYRRMIAEKQTEQHFRQMKQVQEDYVAARERDKMLIPASARS